MRLPGLRRRLYMASGLVVNIAAGFLRSGSLKITLVTSTMRFFYGLKLGLPGLFVLLWLLWTIWRQALKLPPQEPEKGSVPTKLLLPRSFRVRWTEHDTAGDCRTFWRLVGFHHCCLAGLGSNPTP